MGGVGWGLRRLLLKEIKRRWDWAKNVAFERPGGNESKRVSYIKKENINI